MSDPLNDLFDDLDTIKDKPRKSSPSKREGRTKSYRSALAESSTDRRRTARATGKQSTVAGKFIRRSFTYRPEQLDSIEQLAAQLSLSKNDLIRWFVDMGIEAVENGVQPPTTQEVRHRYDPS